MIDIFNFFFQLLIHLDYRDCFTFINQRGIKHSNIIFIKYTNSFLYIQCFIDQILKKHREYCKAFIDDITIFSDSFKNYIEYLNSVFSLFQKKYIGFNVEKSFIKYLFIELLGFYIDVLNIHSIENCIQNFCQLKFPITLKTLETYLGATSFLYTMILYYIQISNTLYR